MKETGVRREEKARVELARSWSVTAGGGEGGELVSAQSWRGRETGARGRGVGVSRLFRAGTKESRMTNAKRARGQPDPRAKSRRAARRGDKRGCWKAGSPPTLVQRTTREK